LLGCPEIITPLTKAKPEEVKKARIATIYPCGITDPAKLKLRKI